MLIIAIILLVGVGVAAWQNAAFAEYLNISQAQSLLILFCVILALIVYLIHIFYIPSALKSTRESQINCAMIGALGLVGPHIFLNISKIAVHGYGELTTSEPSIVGFICALAAFSMGYFYQKEYIDLCRPPNIAWSSEGHTLRALGLRIRR